MAGEDKKITVSGTNSNHMKYQVIIIGGGPAGYTAAETAGKAGLSVLLFEKQNLGGVCLNEGMYSYQDFALFGKDV